MIDNNFVKPEYWIAAEDDERYRRSIYLFRKRSMPDPVLGGFDAPNGDFSCARRLRSNSPLSALASLNEPVFLEAARALAFRVLRESGTSEQERIDLAFRLCTGRHALEQEKESLRSFLASQRARIDAGELNAAEIVASDQPLDIDVEEAAIWVITARVMMNLDETLNKN